MKNKVNYIVVGLGLAGIAFCEQLIKAKKSFLVFENNSQVSSVVAGGTYNPVILKRFTPVWNAHEQLETALPFYKEIEQRLSIKLDSPFKTRKIFTSVGDENNWFIASDKPMLSHYMNPTVVKEKLPGIVCDFGYGELNGTGRIDTPLLVNSYKNYLRESKLLLSEKFDYEDLILSDNKYSYKDYEVDKIVFCEGFGLKENPFFNYLPLNGTKGEVITIYAPELKIDFLLKAAVFIMPIGNDTYKVGATFNWTDKTSIPTKEGKEELVEKLKKVINVPFDIIDHKAGIRPTVKDRRPLVGIHPKYSKLAVLNGLGTRGVMIAPTVAKNLFNYLENNQELDKEIDIKRFKDLF